MVDLALEWSRDLGPLDSPTRTGWRLHALYSAQTEFTARQWQHWMRYKTGTLAEWQTRPATSIFEAVTEHDPPNESRGLHNKHLSLLLKTYCWKGSAFSKRAASHTRIENKFVLEDWSGTRANRGCPECAGGCKVYGGSSSS